MSKKTLISIDWAGEGLYICLYWICRQILMKAVAHYKSIPWAVRVSTSTYMVVFWKSLIKGYIKHLNVLAFRMPRSFQISISLQTTDAGIIYISVHTIFLLARLYISYKLATKTYVLNDCIINAADIHCLVCSIWCITWWCSVRDFSLMGNTEILSLRIMGVKWHSSVLPHFCAQWIIYLVSLFQNSRYFKFFIMLWHFFLNYFFLMIDRKPPHLHTNILFSMAIMEYFLFVLRVCVWLYLLYLWKDLSNRRLKNTNWFACFSLFLMFEAGAHKTAMAIPPTVLPTAGQYPPMLVSGNFLSRSVT